MAGGLCYNERLLDYLLMERFFLFSLFLYLLSALLATGSNRSESKYSLPISKAAYLAGAGVTGLILFFQLKASGSWVISNFFEGVLFTLVVVGLVFLVGLRRAELPLAPGILSVLSIVLGVLALFRLEAAPQAMAAPTGALSSHTYCMFIALAAFSLSFIFSALFLLQEVLIKRRKIGKLFFNLPPLELTSRLNFSCLSVGTAAFFAGVLGGMIQWNKTPGAGSMFLEPAVPLSFLMLVAYLFVVTLRIGPLERARTVSYTSMICYVLLLFVFFGAHA